MPILLVFSLLQRYQTTTMSTFTTYELAVPVLTRGLLTFDHILRKAEAYAKANGIDADAVYPSARLVADQLPLVFQVQNATKTVRNYVITLTGEDIPTFEDNEKTIADLHARIQSALALLKKLTPDVANERGDSQSSTFSPSGSHPVTLKAKDAVLFQAIPNFIFHLTTGYSILRAQGVPVGKADFIANFIGVPGFEALAYPFAQLIDDRYRRKSVIYVSAAISIIGTVLQTASHNVATFVVARIFFGFCAILGGNAASVLVAESVHSRDRKVVTSLYNSSYYIGAILAAWTTYGTCKHILNAAHGNGSPNDELVQAEFHEIARVLDAVGVTSDDEQTLINGILSIVSWVTCHVAAWASHHIGRRVQFLMSATTMLGSFVAVTVAEAIIINDPDNKGASFAPAEGTEAYELPQWQEAWGEHGFSILDLKAKYWQTVIDKHTAGVRAKL
ncbi:hypothetical protein SBRCBS47491_000822 [Sporothrix bragantina]|uniref:Major facilitator superfamily (MFS) profile domain-containing protein n=1 Tax=Sporothrix bragantina TaxID=671064 RepID=A0ABP0ATX9_9PEZI